MISLLGALLVGAGIYFIFSGVRRARSESNSLSARLAVYDARHMTETEIELETRSFRERVVAPLASQLGAAAASRTPQKQMQELRRKLDSAGRPGNLSPETFIALRIGAGVGFFVLGLMVGVLTGSPTIESLAAVGGAALGYFFPQLWLNQKIGNRRQDILKSLPDTLDLLTISVEAGLSFDQSAQRVVAKFHNALSEELEQMQSEVALGRPRLEALDSLGRRCGVDDLHNFVQAVVQSEQMGVGIAKILRLQSDEMRRRRRQRAQEKAAQATLKMLLPMVGCIFPTLWIVLLGPAVLLLLKARGGG